VAEVAFLAFLLAVTNVEHYPWLEKSPVSMAQLVRNLASSVFTESERFKGISTGGRYNGSVNS
jgi:hypothetical protein